jgi:hypothetical protein
MSKSEQGRFPPLYIMFNEYFGYIASPSPHPHPDLREKGGWEETRYVPEASLSLAVAEARDAALDAAVNSVAEWMILKQKAYEQGGFSFPKEAEREHGNTMRLLSCVQNSILRLAGREDKVIAKLKERIAERKAQSAREKPTAKGGEE